VAKSLSSSHSSLSLSNTEGSSQGIHLELPQSHEDQCFELGIIPSIQPLSSHPPPSDSWSPQEVDLETPDNPIQIHESMQTPESSHRLVIHPLNPLFDSIVISHQRPYNPYDRSGIPLELSPCTYQVPCH